MPFSRQVKAWPNRKSAVYIIVNEELEIWSQRKDAARIGVNQRSQGKFGRLILPSLILLAGPAHRAKAYGGFPEQTESASVA
jgi:hypothetical protein